MRYDKHEKLRYTVVAKKTFPVTINGLVNFKIKGGCDVDKEFKEVARWCCHLSFVFVVVAHCCILVCII